MIHRCHAACVIVCYSGAYKVYVETVEHIERDLQIFRNETKQLTIAVNKVLFFVLIFVSYVSP